MMELNCIQYMFLGVKTNMKAVILNKENIEEYFDLWKVDKGWFYLSIDSENEGLYMPLRWRGGKDNDDIKKYVINDILETMDRYPKSYKFVYLKRWVNYPFRLNENKENKVIKCRYEQYINGWERAIKVSNYGQYWY